MPSSASDFSSADCSNCGCRRERGIVRISARTSIPCALEDVEKLAGAAGGMPNRIDAHDKNGKSSSMATVSARDLAAHVGQDVTLQGWLHNKRSSGKLHFLELRDGTGVVQCVVFKGNV